MSNIFDSLKKYTVTAGHAVRKRKQGRSASISLIIGKGNELAAGIIQAGKPEAGQVESACQAGMNQFL